MKESYLENEYVEFWIEDGILIEIFKPNVTLLDLDAVTKIVEDRKVVSAGYWMPLYVDTVDAGELTKEARDNMAKKENLDLISASAFLYRNYTTYMGAKLFLLFNKPAVPIRLFKSKSRAISWLKGFVD